MRLGFLLAAGTVLFALGCGDDATAPTPATDTGAGGSTSGSGAAPATGSGSGGSAGAASTGAGGVPDPELDAFLEEAITAGNVPGLSAAVLRDGDVVWTGAYGLADVAESKPVTPDTLFLLASISKTIVSVALMQLEEEGKLSLDDVVSTLVPFEVAHPDYPADAITVRMLATHTSSIRDDWNTLDANYVPGDSPIALADFVEGYLVPGGAFFSAATNFTPDPPGTSWEYSNVAITLAAYVVEYVSGEPFDAYCQSHVFTPLQMTETSWRIADLDPSHVAIPYEFTGGTYEPFGHYGYPDYPDGLLRTSAPQLGRFLSAFIHDGTLDGATVLTAPTVESMRTPQIPSIDPTQGIIWYYDGDSIGHTGGDLGVSTSMFYRPADGAGVIFLMNGEPSDATWFAIELALWDKADRL